MGTWHRRSRASILLISALSLRCQGWANIFVSTPEITALAERVHPFHTASWDHADMSETAELAWLSPIHIMTWWIEVVVAWQWV